MRDLYRHLGVSQLATTQDIRNAISACKSVRIRNDASEVLLVAERRRQYDQLHSVLSDIGALRAQLGLNHGDNWRSTGTDDFTSESARAQSIRDSLVARIHQANKKARYRYRFKFGAIVAGFVVFIWFAVIFSEQSDSPSITSMESGYTRTAQPTFTEPEQMLPASGTTRPAPSTAGVAPLEIHTSAGSNYLVKLENSETGQKILDVFIRGGLTVNIKVPLGQYRLKYATGTTWYGYVHYFGPSTVYSKANSILHFYRDGYRVSGYTVTLYHVAGGNLSTSRIPPEQF